MANQQYPKLVNKQFNSPINLYSESNVREVIERESQLLSNGAIGINFNNPVLSKPANLQNSAVLRMLEEEERRQRNGYAPSVKRVAWPPPREGEDSLAEAPQNAQDGAQNPSSPGLQNNHAPNPNQRWGQTPASNIQAHKPVTGAPYQPSGPQSPSSGYSPAPFLNHGPSGFTSPTISQKSWAPVQSPVTTPGQPQYYSNPAQQQQAPQQQYQAPQQQYQAPQQQYPQNQYQQAAAPQGQQNQQQYKPQTTQAFKPVQEPPPSTITLRPQAPVSQAPPPVVTSQPATATLKGGKNLRGDLKWPPEDVRKRMNDERQHLIDLSKGPAIRPLKPHKDYSDFFAKHALQHNYPGYKIPPGTQFYESVN